MGYNFSIFIIRNHQNSIGNYEGPYITPRLKLLNSDPGAASMPINEILLGQLQAAGEPRALSGDTLEPEVSVVWIAEFYLLV